jgi:hypothetical protein
LLQTPGGDVAKLRLRASESRFTKNYGLACFLGLACFAQQTQEIRPRR